MCGCHTTVICTVSNLRRVYSIFVDLILNGSKKSIRRFEQTLEYLQFPATSRFCIHIDEGRIL